MKRIIIFGCGDVGIKAMHKLAAEGNEVIAFTDNNDANWGSYCESKKIISPNEIFSLNFDYIAIGVFKAAEMIRKQLYEMGIREEQIIVPIKPDRIFPIARDLSKDKLDRLPDCEYSSNNTIKYQNLNVKIDDAFFFKNLDNLKRALLKNNIPREKVCIVSGAVLQAFGLRKTQKYDDIDIIMTSDLRSIYGNGLVIVSDVIEMHKKDGYYICDDDIIKNMDFHFVFDDLKFMHPHILLEYVRSRNQEEYALLKTVKFDLERGSKEDESIGKFIG